MSPVAHSIDLAVKAGLLGALRDAGFRGTARDFHRSRGLVTDAVNIQASRSNAGQDGRFTVNLGIYLPGVEAVLRGAPLADPPREVDCTVRVRLATVARGGGDGWWAVGAGLDPSVVGREVGETMTRFGIPWFDAVTGPDDVARRGLPCTDLTRAAVLFVSGHRDDTIDLMRENVLRSSAAWAAWRGLAERTGLLDHFLAARPDARSAAP
ncbi:MAG: DUF4304 domain-containing protein [Gemmatimonadetes bacterium]|nr:DUF4304 domain-containing protein [Gemmatimonadota bacterium]